MVMASSSLLGPGTWAIRSEWPMAPVLAHRVRHPEMSHVDCQCGACMLLNSVVVKAASQMMALGWKAACLQ